jgi:hypothetical protein
MRRILIVLLTGCIFSFLSCATDTPAPADAPEVSLAETSALPGAEAPVGLDAAIARVAEYFIATIPRGSKVAVTGVEVEHIALSDYLAAEFDGRLAASRGYTMISRGASRAAAVREAYFQNSGEISPESLHRIGEALGPDIIVYGFVRPYQGAHRLEMYATGVETHENFVRTVNVNLPREWQGPPELADKIERAVISLGRGLYTQTPVIVGSICVTGTTASTTLSDYLRPRLMEAMQKQSDLFRALDETSGAVSDQALLEAARTIASGGGTAAVPARLVGGFPARDDSEDVPVAFSLRALADGAVLGSASLTLTAREMAANRLSALPPNTTREKFEAKRKALSESGKDNAFVLRVEPEKAIYHEGDFLYFTIYAEEDCYFLIRHYDAEDNLSLMFPANARDWERNKLKAGETRRFPDTPRYLLAPPFGLENIIVTAYREDYREGIKVNAERPAPVSPAALLQELFRGYVDRNNPDNFGRQTVIDSRPAANASFSYTILEKR